MSRPRTPDVMMCPDHEHQMGLFPGRHSGHSTCVGEQHRCNCHRELPDDGAAGGCSSVK
ncbi:MAG: hypothetical protein ACYSUD_16600 [Planctomycetota bacterium]